MKIISIILLLFLLSFTQGYISRPHIFGKGRPWIRPRISPPQYKWVLLNETDNPIEQRRKDSMRSAETNEEKKEESAGILLKEEKDGDEQVKKLIAQVLTKKSFVANGTMPVSKLEKMVRKQVCKKIELVGDTLDAANLFTDDYVATATDALKEGVTELQSTVGEPNSGYTTQEELDSHRTTVEDALGKAKNSQMNDIDVILDAQYEAFGCAEFEKDGKMVFFDIGSIFSNLLNIPSLGSIFGGGSKSESIVNTNENTNNIVIQNTIPGQAGSLPVHPNTQYSNGGGVPVQRHSASAARTPTSAVPHKSVATSRQVTPTSTVDSVSMSTVVKIRPEETKPDEEGTEQEPNSEQSGTGTEGSSPTTGTSP